MLLHRFEVEGLAHYSYAVGCPDAGVMAIVDPERNVERYLEFADRHSVRIGHVLETHIHADYASGARELAHRFHLLRLAQLGLQALARRDVLREDFERVVTGLLVCDEPAR